MPRLSRTVLKGNAQQQLTASRKEATSDLECEQSVQDEWSARGADEQFAAIVISWLRQAGTAAGHRDPGPLLEILWHRNLRARGVLACKRAEDTVSYKDSIPWSPRDYLHTVRHQLDKNNSAQVEAWKEERVWAGVSPSQQRKVMAQFIFSVIHGRPHGFSSVGRLLPHQAIAKLLLHGLQIFTTTALDTDALHQLHSRHCSTLSVLPMEMDAFNSIALYTDGHKPTTFTSQLPPVGTEVPLFDHLSLHWQLHLVAEVMTHLLPPGCNCVAPEDFCSHSMPPDDQPYNWAAFNKLLLLGMYAPVEEAEAGMRQANLVVMMQQQELAQARKEDVTSACRSMQQTLAHLRQVLHEQLHVELNAAKGAFQLFAAQPHHPPGLMKQLQHLMMNSCQPSDLWSLSNSSSSSPQHIRDFILPVMCALLAWPLLNLQEAIPGSLADLCGNMHSADGLEGLRRGDSAARASENKQPAHLQPLMQLLHLAVPGYGDTQRNRKSSGLKDSLDSLPSETIDTPQQQEQQALLTRLLEVLHLCLNPAVHGDEVLQGKAADSTLTAAEAAAPAGDQDTMDNTAAGGSATRQVHSTSCNSDSTISCSSGEPRVEPCKVLQLQSFTRGVCHLLLVRLLSAAPPCEEWSWEVCLCILQLVVAVEQVICASGQVAHSSVTASIALADVPQVVQRSSQQARQQQQDARQQQQPRRSSSLSRQQQQQQQGACEQQDRDVRSLEECSKEFAKSWNNKLQLYLQQYIHQLSCMMLSLRKAEAALQDLQEQGSHCSSSSTGADCVSSTVVQSSSKSSSSSSEEFTAGNFWRRQTLNLYRETRSSAFNWMQKHFEKFEPSNENPGFWGLIGRFAAREQLNLRHALAPAALAATPLSYTHFDDLSMDQQGLAMLSQHLARLANFCLTTGDICGSFLSTTGAIPVQPLALKALLACACMAAQQPQLLAYATPTPVALAKARQYPEIRTNAGDSGSPPGQDMTSAQGGLPPTCQNAAAAAEAACGAWRDDVPFHLSPVTGLAPLFDADQQGPCLVRFMQLLLQYHVDCAAAAQAAVQRLATGLQQQQQRQQQQQQSQQRSQNSCRVPAERSRLLVLLMGLYHMSMLKEQHERQQLQQQYEAMPEYIRSPGHGPQQDLRSETSAGTQPQQQQQGLQAPGHTAKGNRCSAAPSAAAPDASMLYADAQLRYKMTEEAVAAAYDLQDLLLYCLSPLEEQAALMDPAHLQGGAVSVRPLNSSSSSSNSSSSAARFEVCEVSRTLMNDGMRLMLTTSARWGDDEPPRPPCDRCLVEQAGLSTYRLASGLGASQQDGVSPADATCSGCQVFSWCAKCAASPDAVAWHGRFCNGVDGPMQHASRALEVMAADGNQLPGVLHAEAGPNMHSTRCAVCGITSDAAPPRLAVVCELHPLSQNRGMGISQTGAGQQVMHRLGLEKMPGSAPCWEDCLCDTLAGADPSSELVLERFLQPLNPVQRYSMASAASAGLLSRHGRLSTSDFSSSSILLRDQDSISSSARPAAPSSAHGVRDAGWRRSSNQQDLEQQQQQRQYGSLEDSQTQQDQQSPTADSWSDFDKLLAATGLMAVSPPLSGEVDTLKRYFQDQQGYGSRFEQLD